MKNKFDTTPAKRFKILYSLIQELNIVTDGQYSPLLDMLEELAENMEANHPKAMEALCYFEDNIISILTTGMEVKENN